LAPTSHAFSFARAAYLWDIWFCWVVIGLERERGTVTSRVMEKCLPSLLYPSQHTSGRRTRRLDPNLGSGRFSVSPSEQCKEQLNKIRKRSDIPKLGGPLGGTILPGVRPWNRIGSSPGPAENANVQTADADLSSYAERRLFSPV
jgi:hypothetical protein